MMSVGASEALQSQGQIGLLNDFQAYCMTNSSICLFGTVVIDPLMIHT